MLVMMLKRLFQTLLLVYAAVLIGFYILHPRLLYRPSDEIRQTPADFDIKYEDIDFKTSDGVMLNGWFVPAVNSKGVILYNHGNTENIGRRVDMISLFNELGYTVFIYDYRGYGKSMGRSMGLTTERGTYIDARAAWDFLRVKKGFKGNEIIIYGHSLGGPIASHLATEVEAAALVLDSTFTSITELVQEKAPIIPVKVLTDFHYDNIDYLKEVDEAVLVVHSPEDELIPIAHARAVYDSIKGEKRFLETLGKHDNGSATSGELYRKGAADFFSKYLK